jgi:hypothetical protein
MTFQPKGTCGHCGGDISVRNPTGTCDHLQYPDNCDVCKESSLVMTKTMLSVKDGKAAAAGEELP